MYSNGNLYEGEWRRGREWGHGLLMTGTRKVIYDGDFVDGKTGRESMLNTQHHCAPLSLLGLIDIAGTRDSALYRLQMKPKISAPLALVDAYMFCAHC